VNGYRPMRRNMNSSPPPLRGRSDREAVWEGGQEPAHHRLVPYIRRTRAKSLRRDMTEAEKRLWYWLRAHRFDGAGFRRQTPIGPFIVDFVSHEQRLVIELDGGQHAESKRDAWRERWLRSKGYRVLRFWNSDVLKNQDQVLQLIYEATASNGPPSRRSSTSPTIDDLPLKGGGDEVLKGEVRGLRQGGAGVKT
jgi:very-short-patch-repair endonuclease